MLPNKVIDGIGKRNIFFDNFILREPMSKNDFGLIRSLHWEYIVQKKLYKYFPVPQVYNYKNNSYMMGIIEGDSSFSFSEMFDMLNKIHNYKIIIPDKGMNNKKYVDMWKNNHLSIKNKEYADDIIFWLENNCPEDSRRSMIHGDWRIDNLIFKDNKIVGILDWELSGVGDPLLDIGFSMAYWNNKIIGKTDYIDKKNIIDLYQYKIPKFFHVFGFFRISVLVEIGRENFLNGKTYDVRYKNTEGIINDSFNQCRELINK